ncbi:MAG: DHH family phosphoesterase [Planctomycetota bacterium]|jgi:nanoRNase/pAp phosphatase (c-di-AMP/oligoRNAs hydrolase)|nr:DHH family phosphoesterase [Planctomycetota bacterium]
MKVYIIGSGRRLAEMAMALSPRGEKALVLTCDEATYRLCVERHVPTRSVDITSVNLAGVGIQGGSEDLMLISDHDEARLYETVKNIASQTPPEHVLVLTPDSSKQLEKDFPAFVFKSNQSVYRHELREFMRRHQAVQKVNSIRDILKGNRNLLTVVWGNPDPDSISCSLALQELTRDDVDVSEIAYTGNFTRQENLAMKQNLKIPMKKLSPALLEGDPTIATVDAQPSFFAENGTLPFDIVIDHHPTTQMDTVQFTDVRPTYGSTATIFTEYFLYTGKKMSRRLATALFYGLKTDTNNLTRKVHDADVEAFRYLRTRADENMIRNIELSQMPMSTLDTFSIAISNRKVIRDVAFSYIGHRENPDEAVYLVDLFIKLSGITWAVVACRTDEKMVVLFRTDGLRRHAGKIAEETFLDYGTAGGHRTMARAELRIERVQEEVNGLNDVALERWLLGKLSVRLKALKKAIS